MGSTPLHWAATFEKKEIVQILIKHSADVNMKDLKGRTPLHEAAEDDDNEIVQILCKHSADVNM